VLPPNLDEFPTETGPHDWPEGDTLHWFEIVQQACANIKLLTLPLSYPDLVKQAGRRKPKKAQQKYTPEEVEQWERVVKEWDAAMVDLPQIRGNAIIRTNDGEIVLYKLDNALTKGWEDPEVGAKFIAHLTDSLETLREKWNGPLPLPGKSDTRHHALEEMRAKYGADNVGVWHFAFWIAQGQSHRGPVISSNVMARTTSGGLNRRVDFWKPWRRGNRRQRYYSDCSNRNPVKGEIFPMIIVFRAFSSLIMPTGLAGTRTTLKPSAANIPPFKPSARPHERPFSAWPSLFRSVSSLTKTTRTIKKVG
jgi:hypothetical protein